MNAADDSPTRHSSVAIAAPASGSSAAQRLLAWHRRLGLVATVVVLLLSATGLLLNHSHQLALDNKQISAGWLLEWYGFPPIEATSFRAGDRWISSAGSRLHVDGQPVAEISGRVLGAVATAQGFAVAALADALLLLDADGLLVERIGAGSLPGLVQRIGFAGDGRVIIAIAQQRFIADADLLAWQPTAIEPQWSRAESPPAAVQTQIERALRGPGVSAERVLLDLHSGRLFGAWGPWVMDAAAIVFIVLALTGVCNWWWRRRRTARIARRQPDDRNKP